MHLDAKVVIDDTTSPYGEDAVAVRARSLTKHFGDIVAVNGIDFDVRTGECFGFLGPNGAGKTTTMKMIYGLATVGGGELKVLGHDARTERRAIKARLGVVPQEENLDPDLTVLETLIVHAGYFGIKRNQVREKASSLLEFAQLWERRDASIEDLSGGMKHRLMVARALINGPSLVVLDEPTTGLDPQARLAVWAELRELKTDGVTQILTTHYMEEAHQLCDRLVIMDLGRIIAAGSPNQLIERHCGDGGTLEDVFLKLTGRHLRE